MLYDTIELESDEEVLTLVRKHWFIITIELISVGIVILVPLFLLLGTTFLSFGDVVLSFVTEYSDFVSFGIVTWLLLATMAGFMLWTHYYLDLWIVTDRRIIVIDQRGFFNRNVSSFRLERLQDIKVTISGIIPTLLNFGTITAQTASAAESAFTTVGLPNPRELQALIQKATDTRLRNLSRTGTMIQL